MPNSSGTCKTGERCIEAGVYECLNCRQMGVTTHISVESGGLLPFCAVCDLKDNTYKLLPAGKR